MATVIKNFVFAADAEGLADKGTNANIAFAFEGSDGNPAGCIKFTTATASLSSASESGLNPTTTGVTWQTWGVPPGSRVTALKLLGFQHRRPSVTGLTSYSLAMRIVDLNGNNVSGSNLYSAVQGISQLTSWTSVGVQSSINTNNGQQISTRDVRLEVIATISTTTGTINVDLRVDEISLEITYTPPQPDDLTLGESVSGTASGTASDGLALAETTTQSAAVSQAEALTLSEATTQVAMASLSDGLSLGEETAQSAAALVDDALGLGESLTPSAQAMLDEGMSLAEMVVGAGVTAQTDSLGLSESTYLYFLPPPAAPDARTDAILLNPGATTVEEP